MSRLRDRQFLGQDFHLLDDDALHGARNQLRWKLPGPDLDLVHEPFRELCDSILGSLVNLADHGFDDFQNRQRLVRGQSAERLAQSSFSLPPFRFDLLLLRFGQPHVSQIGFGPQFLKNGHAGRIHR